MQVHPVAGNQTALKTWRSDVTVNLGHEKAGMMSPEQQTSLPGIKMPAAASPRHADVHDWHNDIRGRRSSYQ